MRCSREYPQENVSRSLMCILLTFCIVPYVYICMYVCTYVYVCVSVYILYVRMYVCTYYVCVYACMCTFTNPASSATSCINPVTWSYRNEHTHNIHKYAYIYITLVCIISLT